MMTMEIKDLDMVAWYLFRIKSPRCLFFNLNLKDIICGNYKKENGLSKVVGEIYLIIFIKIIK